VSASGTTRQTDDGPDFRLLELRTFKRRFGHARVPSDWPENRPLARWVNKQRARRPKLPAGRKRLLDALGFDWQLPSGPRRRLGVPRRR